MGGGWARRPENAVKKAVLETWTSSYHEKKIPLSTNMFALYLSRRRIWANVCSGEGQKLLKGGMAKKISCAHSSSLALAL